MQEGAVIILDSAYALPILAMLHVRSQGGGVQGGPIEPPKFI